MPAPDLKELGDYIERYFNGDAEARNRPFDTANYHKKVEGSKKGAAKEAGGYGTNAIAWNIKEITISPLTKEYIEQLYSMMEMVLKDLEPFLEGRPEPLKPHIPALKSGYIFNAFNQHLALELKTAIATRNKDKVAELTHQAELIRLVSDNLAKGLDVDKALIQLQSKYQKKVDKIIMDGVKNELAGAHPTFAHSQQLILKQCGIPEDRIHQQIKSLASQGKQLIDEQFLEMEKKSTKFGVNQLHTLRKTLNEAWSKCAVLSPPQDKINESSQKTLVQNFQSLLQFTKDVLSIQRSYESNLGGIRLFARTDSKKEDIIKKINGKMNELLTNYLPDNPKSLGDIHAAMSKYLFDLCINEPTLKSSNPFKIQIERVAGQQQIMAIAARTTLAARTELYKDAQLPEETRKSSFRH